MCIVKEPCQSLMTRDSFGDITFHRPCFDADGAKIQNARMTVVHNGKTIHHDVEIPPTTGATQKNRREKKETTEPSEDNAIQ